MQSFSNFDETFFKTEKLTIGHKMRIPSKMLEGLDIDINKDFVMSDNLAIAVYAYLNCQLRDVSSLNIYETIDLYKNFVSNSSPRLSDYQDYKYNVEELLSNHVANIYKDEIFVAGLICGNHKLDNMYYTICEECGDNMLELNNLKNSFNSIMDKYGLYTFSANLVGTCDELNDIKGMFLVPICNSSTSNVDVDAMYGTIANTITFIVKYKNAGSALCRFVEKFIKDENFINIFINGKYDYKIKKPEIVKPLSKKTLVCADSDDE